MVRKANLAIVKTEPAPVVLDLDHKSLGMVKGKWPQAANSVDEVKIINLVQMLTPDERIHFVNELFRVMKSGAKAQIITPHWCSSRAWGDLAFIPPPVAEGWYFHLNAGWREQNASWGVKYKCDFDTTFGYSLHPSIVPRASDYQQHAVTFWKEAATDIIATLTKR